MQPYFESNRFIAYFAATIDDAKDKMEEEFLNRLMSVFENYTKNEDPVEVKLGITNCFDLVQKEPHLSNIPIASGPFRGLTWLWLAVSWQQWDFVDKTLERQINVNVNAAPQEGAARGASVLWRAAGHQQWDFVAKMLEKQPDANVNASPAEEPNSGASVLWCAAGHQQWDLVAKILERQPDANVNTSPAEGSNRGRTVLWCAASYQQWDLVAKMLECQLDADVNAAPQEELNKGASVLLLAANYEQWDLVAKMLERQPDVNVNASPAEEPGKGASALWFAASREQWDLVAKMLERQPDANVNAYPLEGPNNGASVLWLTASHHQWNLLAKMLEKQPDADVNASPAKGPNNDVSVLWLTANWQQWDLLAKILERQPNSNIDFALIRKPLFEHSVLFTTAISEQWNLVAKILEILKRSHLPKLKGKSIVGRPILNFAFEHLTGVQADKLAYCSMLLGACCPVNRFFLEKYDGADYDDNHSLRYHNIRHNIKLTFERVITLSNMARDQHAQNPFQLLPKELQKSIQLEALRIDCPHIDSLPDNLLLAKIEDFTYAYNQKTLEKAKKFAASLASYTYLSLNNFWDTHTLKPEITNLKKRIVEQLNLQNANYMQAQRNKIAALIATQGTAISQKMIQEAIREGL